MNWTALMVFTFFFALVMIMGFYASRWRRGDLTQLNEWGLAGRRFGTFVNWFLLGGDLYTAYTFIAVPALVFGAGALGFYAIPYSVMAFALAFLFLPRLWAVSKKHDFVTAADFVTTMLMRWSRNMPKPATEWAAIAAYVKRMKARPSFKVLYEREGLTEWA